jgi:hypothetical protein
MWRPAHPIAIELPGRETRHEDMPGVVRAMPPGIEADDAGRLGLLRAIEQPQFHPGGALGEHAEVDPLRGHTWPGPTLLVKSKMPRKAVLYTTFEGQRDSGHSPCDTHVHGVGNWLPRLTQQSQL